MMHKMMSGMGWGMGLAGLIGTVVAVLVIAALVNTSSSGELLSAGANRG